MINITDDIQLSVSKKIKYLDNLRNKKIAIYGANGYTGKWIQLLVNYLNSKEGFGIDLSLYVRSYKHESSICPGKYYSCDLLSIYEIPDDFDFIINCSTSPDISRFGQDIVGSSYAITESIRKLLDVCSRQNNQPRVLHLSSGYVSAYGRNRQEINLSDVEFKYFLAKDFSENICSLYREQYDLDVVVARPFSNLGPFQENNVPWAINSFINQSLNNKKIRILGSGDDLRSYCYGSDYAVALLVVLSSSGDDLVFDIGSEDAVSILDAAKAVASVTGTSAGIEVIGEKSGRDFLADTQAFNSNYGAISNFSLIQMIEKTVQWVKKNYA